MKLEKLNDNQIRCTLTKDDLADRQIKLSELAYGSEKAKSLFRDMMLQANAEFGFEANDIPLMIEAIPMPNDCIVLIITKVSDPEELDTRFSKFSPSNTDVLEPVAEHKKTISVEGADEVLDLFKRMMEQHLKGFEENQKEEAAVMVSSEIDLTRTYCFGSLEDLVKAAHILNGFYHGENRLYRNNERRIFYLVLSKSSHTPEEFNRICNVTSEYGQPVNTGYASLSYFAEHFKLIIKNDALQTLSSI